MSDINPMYSILLCNMIVAEYRDRISKWLADGIKVIWFGKDEDVALLKSEHPDFVQAFLFQAYVTSIDKSGIIIDGQDEDALFEAVSDDCVLFNAAQYQVEHCKADENIIVQASAERVRLQL